MTPPLYNPDSVIFDMDGTLWDAVDSYARIWNVTLDQEGLPHREVTRKDLLEHMGSYLDDILTALAPGVPDRKKLLERLEYNEATMMRTLGGHLYPGAAQTVSALSQRYKLFMVSNCGPAGLDNFVEYTALKPYFRDLLTHGATHVSKAANIAVLMERHALKAPVYVGDTQGDADNAHAAGIPVVWAAYGFGNINNPDAVIHSITELPAVLETLRYDG